MRRRQFIPFLGIAAVGPLAALGQQRDQSKYVGILHPRNADDQENQLLLSEFQRELRNVGPGRAIRFEERGAANNMERLRIFAAELVRSAPDVIFAEGTPAVTALQQNTRSIPVVFVQAQNPIGSGFVQSMAKPGGNITGFVSFTPEMGGKWVEILREIAPQISRIALVFNPRTHTGQYSQSANSAASNFNLVAVQAPFETAADLERQIEQFSREPNGGLLVLPDTSTNFHGKLIASLAERYRLPAVYAFRHFVIDGGLVYFGTRPLDLYRQAASYVHRILAGESPANLPVQAPTRFELVVNVKAAGKLRLPIPPSLNVRADELIE